MPCSMLLVAAGIRIFIRSPFVSFTLRDAVVFVLIAVIIVPFGTAFWGAAFTVSNNFGTHYWIEWRNLGVSNAGDIARAGAGHPAQRPLPVHPSIERSRRAARGGHHAQPQASSRGRRLTFDRQPAGPDTSPTLLYAPVPLLLWAALRFGLGGMSTSMLVITIIAIWGTMHGRGPLPRRRRPRRMRSRCSSSSSWWPRHSCCWRSPSRTKDVPRRRCTSARSA